MKLMIVEDSREMRWLIKSTVATSGDEVYEVTDGTEAASAYAQCQPDFVLMDMEMPWLDGVSATRGIMKSFPEARIIVASQYNDITIREAAREAGAVEYLLKDNLLDLKRIPDHAR